MKQSTKESGPKEKLTSQSSPESRSYRAVYSKTSVTRWVSLAQRSDRRRLSKQQQQQQQLNTYTMTKEKFKDLTLGVFESYSWGYGDVAPEILENRVKFYTDFNLQKAWRSGILSSLPWVSGASQSLDHLEAYRTLNQGIVVICSNYGGTTPPPWMFMVECLSLYNGAAKTYIRHYSSEHDARRHISAAESLNKISKTLTYDSMVIVSEKYGFIP